MAPRARISRIKLTNIKCTVESIGLHKKESRTTPHIHLFGQIKSDFFGLCLADIHFFVTCNYTYVSMKTFFFVQC